MSLRADVRYRETKPGRIFRSYWIGGRQQNEWTYGHERSIKSAVVYTNQTWRNFWNSQATLTRNFLRYDCKPDTGRTDHGGAARLEPQPPASKPLRLEHHLELRYHRRNQ